MLKKLTYILAAVAIIAVACTKKEEKAPEAAPAPVKKTTLETVKERGMLKCGVNTGLTGFSAPNSEGKWEGLDVDLCRAVAAAIFGDDTKVEYIALNAQQRFTALQSGEVDMLSRNTTRTLQRDSALGLNFGPVMYYDGQGFMVKKSSKITSAAKLKGATICVQPGTTTEQNLADYFRKLGTEYKPVVIESADEVTNAYFTGRCDAFTTDASGLAAERTKAEKPEDHVILPEIISKEPLAPAVRHGDDQWLDIVTWAAYAMLNAEELGLTSANIDAADTTNPTVARIVDSELGASLGLDNKWAYNIIKLVGNYGDSFEKNLGENTGLKLKRGLNAQWTQGGLQYAPPIK